MRIDLQQKTVVQAVRDGIETWRRTTGNPSRESVAIMVDEAHAEIGAHWNWFKSESADAYSRAKCAAQKLFERWLYGDKEPLPANMLPTLYAALPMDLRLQAVNEWLRQVGMVAHSLEAVEGADFDASSHASALVKENSEAAISVLAIGMNPSVPAMEAALKEVADVQETASRTERALRAAIAAGRSAVSKLRAAG